ncbi:hypothetical protein BT69DRAFT_1349735 [Atractiella rhizophila]|nr:hypothetical protein BT69DRAFT_1349735 [Atractiella rhizophila]
MTATGIASTNSAVMQDPELKISSCMAAAKRMQVELEPVMSWQHIYKTMHGHTLEKLDRHPAAQTIYETEFLPLLRREYGSVEQFLKRSITFSPSPTTIQSQFRAEGAVEGRDFIIRLNDWPYSIPRDALHYVIWTPHRLAPSPDACSPTIEQVRRVGIAGFSGFTEASGNVKKVPEEGKEMAAMIKRLFPEATWEVCWFWNPPSLQSVPNAAHFHAIVRRKTGDAVN